MLKFALSIVAAFFTTSTWALEGPLDSSLPIKVMGRGIQDRQTGERLQFACVEASMDLQALNLSSIPLDPECPEVRPLYQNTQGELYYLDTRYPIFAPDPEAKGRDKRFQKRIQKGLEQAIILDIERLQNLKKETGLEASKKRLLKTEAMETLGELLPISGFGAYFFGSPLLEGATLVMSPAAWGFAGFFAAPITLFTLPVLFHVLSQAASSPGKIFSKNSLGDLEDFEARDRSYWQFKANKINHSLFRSVYRTFAKDDGSVSLEGKHPTVIKEIQFETTQQADWLEFEYVQGSYPILKEGKPKNTWAPKVQALQRMQGHFSSINLRKGEDIVREHVRQRALFQPENQMGDVLKVSYPFTNTTWGGCSTLTLERVNAQGITQIKKEKVICNHKWKQLPKTLERFMDEIFAQSK